MKIKLDENLPNRLVPALVGRGHDVDNVYSRIVRGTAGGALPDVADAHGYLRIAIHPGIFAAPLAPDEALTNVKALLALPQVRVVSEQDGFMDAYIHVTADVVVRGNLVPDAHVAAILFQNGVRTLYSNDRDFRKFESLEVRDPLA